MFRYIFLRPICIPGLPWWVSSKESTSNAGDIDSEVAQSCPTLCDPIDCSLPGSSIHGIVQAKVREWVAISYSKRPLLNVPVDVNIDFKINNVALRNPFYLKKYDVL